MNELPCGKCIHYDPVLGPGEKDTKRGWCVKKSKYPAVEGPGQVFPVGATRVAIGSLAEPYLVKKDQVVPPCPDAKEARIDVLDKKRASQTVKNAQGQRVLT